MLKYSLKNTKGKISDLGKSTIIKLQKQISIQV